MTARDERTKDTRRALVDAAAALFAERGYRATGLVEIADRAGISRGSIPWHFGDKLGLLDAVLDDRIALLVPDRTGDSPDALVRVIALLRAPEARLFITLLAEAVDDESPLRPRCARLHRALREAAEEHLVAAGLPPGVDPASAAAVVVGAVIGVHAQWRVAPDAVDPEALAVVLPALFPLGR